MMKKIKYAVFWNCLGLSFCEILLCFFVFLFFHSRNISVFYVLFFFFLLLTINYFFYKYLVKFTKPDALLAKKFQIKENEFSNKRNYRRKLLGNIAHEMKTPLFTVQSYILTLLEEENPPPTIYKNYLKRANAGIQRLETIVKNLEMIYKLENNLFQLNRTVFNIIHLIQCVFDMVEIPAMKKNISLKFEKLYEYPRYVFADKEKIEDVLTNLFINAIKYGKIGGHVIVGIQTSDAKNCIKISDNGIGIAKKHLPRIFDRFYRVEKSGSRQTGGSGLGLSIVKHILEAHGENVQVTSEKTKGTTFAFSLPSGK